VIAVVVAALCVAAWVGWRSLPRSQSGRFCSVTGSIGTPVAGSPDAAFAAWFNQSGPSQAVAQASIGNTSSRPAAPTIHDFVKLSSREWEWRYASGQSVQVAVGRGPSPMVSASGWAVVGVNQCGTTEG
jgi:hypothetical protein